MSDFDHNNTAPGESVEGRMSRRLVTVADMLGNVRHNADTAAGAVTSGTLCRFKCVADVGCDHGYVSLYLVQHGIADRAIAMDIRKGPLAMADNNINSFGLSDCITTRLSDGLSLLEPGEADCLVIAGMGGKLMISILEKKSLRELGIEAAVLQPQSDLDEFRQYLRYKGYRILQERVILEDGKYYFPLRIEIKSESGQDDGGDNVSLVSKLLGGISFAEALRICNRYGEHNILERDPVLKDFLVHGKEVCQSILGSLDRELHRGRYNQVNTELEDLNRVLEIYTR